MSTDKFYIMRGVEEAQSWIRAAQSKGQTVGTAHTLGALHIGHAKLIEVMARENDHAVVSIFPNRTQFPAGHIYEYNLDKDIEIASRAGAVAAVIPSEEEMFPSEYRTFLDQGEIYSRMDGGVVPFLFRGMITMSFRWVNALRPDRSYWGMKDIGQSLLVKRAIEDFMVPVDLRFVPCVRTDTGVPVSSRLRNLEHGKRCDVILAHEMLQWARNAVSGGIHRRSDLLRAADARYGASPFEEFELHYFDCFDPADFGRPEKVSPPFILHLAMTDGEINHFDGLYIRDEDDLRNGPPVIRVSDGEFFGLKA